MTLEVHQNTGRKILLLYLSVHCGDWIEQIKKKKLSYTLKDDFWIILWKQCQRICALTKCFFFSSETISKVDNTKNKRRVSLLFPLASTCLSSFYCSPSPIFSLLHGLEAAFRRNLGEILVIWHKLLTPFS